jgi:hypothetical protein
MARKTINMDKVLERELLRLASPHEYERLVLVFNHILPVNPTVTSSRRIDIHTYDENRRKLNASMDIFDLERGKIAVVLPWQKETLRGMRPEIYNAGTVHKAEFDKVVDHVIGSISNRRISNMLRRDAAGYFFG